MNNYLRTTSTPRVQTSRILQKHAYRAALNLIIDLGNQFKNVPPKVSISAINAAAVLLCCSAAYRNTPGPLTSTQLSASSPLSFDDPNQLHEQMKLQSKIDDIERKMADARRRHRSASAILITDPGNAAAKGQMEHADRDLDDLQRDLNQVLFNK